MGWTCCDYRYRQRYCRQRLHKVVKANGWRALPCGGGAPLTVPPRRVLQRQRESCKLLELEAFQTGDPGDQLSDHQLYLFIRSRTLTLNAVTTWTPTNNSFRSSKVAMPMSRFPGILVVDSLMPARFLPQPCRSPD